MSSTVAVEELRIGMYIHLEGGWLSHPFPLSSFRISSAEQISTLRGLGLARVRWIPEKSDLPTVDAPAGAASSGGLGEEGAVNPTLTPEMQAAAQRGEWLAAQREAAQRCERQYGEAALAWRAMNDEVVAQPQLAGRTGLALTRAMLDKMLGSEDIGIRLVGGGADRAAAHALNVAVISLLIGRTLNLSEAEMADLGVGA